MQLQGGEAGEVFMGGFIYVFLQKSTLTLYHNPLKVYTHDRADQNLQCAKAQPLNKRQVKQYAAASELRVVMHASQQTTRKPPRGANASADSFNTALT